jgi:rubrerythrin
MTEGSRGTTAGESINVVDRLLAQMRHHVASEKAILERYRNLARVATQGHVRYLLTMIAEEEERHHARMAQISNAIRREFRNEIFEPAVPDFSVLPLPYDLANETRAMLEIERRDEIEMVELASRLSGIENSALWVMVVETLIADTRKHQVILEFILEHSEGAIPDVVENA